MENNKITLEFEIGKVYKTKFQSQELFEVKDILYNKDNIITGFKGIYVDRLHLGICPIGADRLIPETRKPKLEVLGINCVLYTKDGRKIGNAIVTGKTDKDWEITTDYGSILENILEKEIEELYYIGHNHNGEEEMELSKFMRETHINFVHPSKSEPSFSIIYNAKCKHCKWFDYHYKGKRKVHKCNLTEETLTLKSKSCNKFEL